MPRITKDDLKAMNADLQDQVITLEEQLRQQVTRTAQQKERGDQLLGERDAARDDLQKAETYIAKLEGYCGRIEVEDAQQFYRDCGAETVIKRDQFGQLSEDAIRPPTWRPTREAPAVKDGQPGRPRQHWDTMPGVRSW